MRKILAILMILAMAFTCAAEAEQMESGDWLYTVNEDGSATISMYMGMEGNLAVPAELDGHPVKEIGKAAFAGNCDLLSVVIPEGVEAIGSGAFESCECMESVSLPNGLLSIGTMAFCYCSSLEEITIPETVTTLDTNVVDNCDLITSVRIPNSVVNYSGPPVENLNVPTEIIVSPDHPVFEVVDGSLFDKTLKKLVAFRVGDRGASYDIPEGTEIIGVDAFQCASLQHITIPESVKIIEKSAFAACELLESLMLPEGVVSIGASAFSNCWEMKSINIPDGATEIGDGIFQGCTSLKDLRISPDQPVLTLVDGVLFSKDLKRLIWYPPARGDKTYTVPAGTEVLGADAFEGAQFESIVIPDSVTSIGKSCFLWCTQLKEITIPSGVTEIGHTLLCQCHSLQKAVFPENMTEIPKYTFQDCKALKHYEIPASVTSIGACAFRGCDALESVVIHAGVEFIGDFAFDECPSLTVTVVPGSAAEQYCLENGIPAK